MLAGVSHDLRTPLTRMKLQLAMFESSKEIEDLKSDLIEMEKMVEGYLNFARGEETEESHEIKLSDFLFSIQDSYVRQNKKFDLAINSSDEIKIKPNLMKRAVCNLIDNAFRYGKEVKITGDINNGYAIIIVDDNGTGIPKEKREEVFKPFFRMEASRNQETGGVGLGLTIANDIVHSHGGEIILDDSPAGGLRATIRLPI